MAELLQNLIICTVLLLQFVPRLKVEKGMNSGVYIITNMVTGDRYVGSSKNIRIRIQFHWSRLRHGKHHNRFMQRSWNKYGGNVFQYCILELTECTREALINREQYYINTLKPEFNANPTAATNFGIKHNKESKTHIGTLNGMFGKSHSTETKDKISESLKGHSVSEKTKKKKSEAMLSLSIKEKIRLAAIVSKAQTGRHCSLETRIKISEAAKKRPKRTISEDQKAKISASLKGHPFYGNKKKIR
jgi:group I intron endonuclease